MTNEVRFGKIWVRRKGNVIEIDPCHNRVIQPFQVGLAIVLGENQEIAIDPEWQREQLETQAHFARWTEMVEKLKLPVGLACSLIRVPPPPFVASEAEMVDYLSLLTLGDSVTRLYPAERQVIADAVKKAFLKKDGENSTPHLLKKRDKRSRTVRQQVIVKP